ncbi:MAG: hypothetical protein ACEQSA_00235 [Weeksellaceae bacterium]
MYLSKDIVATAIIDHVYEVPDEKESISRCFTQTVFTPEAFIPPVSLPGGDLGEFAILVAAATEYGFEFDAEKLFSSVCAFYKGDILALEPSLHLPYLFKDPHLYGLEKHIQILEKYIKRDQKIQITNYHKRFAGVILVESNHGITPEWQIETDAGLVKLPVLILHKSFIDKRHQILAQQLIDTKAVELYGDLGVDYLYEVLSEMTDVHAMETLKHIDPQLPFFAAKEKEPGIFAVEQYI